MSDKTYDYIISGGLEGKTRLNILADVLHNYTMALLKQQGLTNGMAFFDNGCGGGNVALMAAKLVGDKGRVTAIDFDEVIVELAKEDAAAAGINNIDFKAISAYDIDFKGKFDVAYARFLLSHLNNPLDALLRMKQGVKPGGKIIVEDVHFSGHFCYPTNDAFNYFVKCYTLAAQHKGANAEIGPALVGLFNAAGIEQVGFDVIQPCFYNGMGKWMAYTTFNNIKNVLLAHKIADADSISHTLQQLEAFTRDEQSMMSLPRIFRVWGTVPPIA